MSTNTTTKCKVCGLRGDLCNCPYPSIVCGTCDKAPDQCNCTDYQYHQCEACFEWRDCSETGDAWQWICERCLAKPMVKFQLNHGGV